MFVELCVADELIGGDPLSFEDLRERTLFSQKVKVIIFEGMINGLDKGNV